jgi:hypothetical protein
MKLNEKGMKNNEGIQLNDRQRGKWELRPKASTKKKASSIIA